MKWVILFLGHTDCQTIGQLSYLGVKIKEPPARNGSLRGVFFLIFVFGSERLVTLCV